jgi:hypothetical protein
MAEMNIDKIKKKAYENALNMVLQECSRQKEIISETNLKME